MVKFVLLRFQLHIKQSNFDYNNKKNQAFGLGFFCCFCIIASVCAIKRLYVPDSSAI